MIQLSSASELGAFRKEPSGSLGFVPTMGALHEGHHSLINAAISQCDAVLVSIFVNPTQFAPTEDFNDYPRNLESDLNLCESWGVTAVFCPTEDDIYPNNNKEARYVPSREIAEVMCGKTRPHFFYGVTNVVERLFGLVRPSHAFFGDKDLQQRVIIEQMVSELNLPIEIIGCPIIRDDNGLARSSRNAYLDDEGYQKALNISRALHDVKVHVKNDKWSSHRVRQFLAAELEGRGLKGDYVDVFRPTTGEIVNGEIKPGDHCCVAAWCDNVRLIDNQELA